MWYSESFSLRKFSGWENISHSHSSRITRGKVRQAKMEMLHQFKRRRYILLKAVLCVCFRLKRIKSEMLYLTLDWILNCKKSYKKKSLLGQLYMEWIQTSVAVVPRLMTASWLYESVPILWESFLKFLEEKGHDMWNWSSYSSRQKC